MILDLESVRDDDHVVVPFKIDGCWGALAKSNYAGLGFREPVYRSLRELVMSYFEHYYNLKGEKTLRAFSRPVNLKRFDSIDWMTAEEDLWDIAEYLTTISHTPILQTQRRMYMNKRQYEAGLVGQVAPKFAAIAASTNCAGDALPLSVDAAIEYADLIIERLAQDEAGAAKDATERPDRFEAQ